MYPKLLIAESSGFGLTAPAGKTHVLTYSNEKDKTIVFKVCLSCLPVQEASASLHIRELIRVQLIFTKLLTQAESADQKLQWSDMTTLKH